MPRLPNWLERVNHVVKEEEQIGKRGTGGAVPKSPPKSLPLTDSIEIHLLSKPS